MTEEGGNGNIRGIKILGAVLLVAVLVTALGCCCTRSTQATVYRPAAARAPTPPAAEGQPVVPPGSTSDSLTTVEMCNVHFRLDSTLVLRIHRLKGTMQPRSGRQVIDFGAPRSFLIRLRNAEVGMRPSALRHLLNRYVFGYEGAPLTIHAIRTRDSLLWQSGTLHKVVDIPFEMTARPTVTPAGRIRLHPVSMQICGIPGKGLMRAVGVDLEELLDLRRAEGVYAEGNDLVLDPAAVLPPPAIRGQLTAVRVEDEELVQVFGAPGDTTWRIREQPTPPDPAADNYMFYRGGMLRFGKLLMVRADLQIVDADPDDHFDFFLEHYKAQLVAGYSRTLPDFGLKVYMPDYAALGRGGSSVRPTDRRATGERDAANRRPRPVSSTERRDHG